MLLLLHMESNEISPWYSFCFTQRLEPWLHLAPPLLPECLSVISPAEYMVFQGSKRKCSQETGSGSYQSLKTWAWKLVQCHLCSILLVKTIIEPIQTPEEETLSMGGGSNNLQPSLICHRLPSGHKLFTFFPQQNTFTSSKDLPLQTQPITVLRSGSRSMISSSE